MSEKCRSKLWRVTAVIYYWFGINFLGSLHRHSVRASAIKSLSGTEKTAPFLAPPISKSRCSLGVHSWTVAGSTQTPRDFEPMEIPENQIKPRASGGFGLFLKAADCGDFRQVGSRLQIAFFHFARWFYRGILDVGWGSPILRIWKSLIVTNLVGSGLQIDFFHFALDFAWGL